MDIIYTNTISAENYCMLRKAVSFSEISESQAKAALDRSDYIIAANIDNVPIGMSRLMTDGLQVLIMDVIVHPDYQGEGIGRQLMQYIMDYIQNLAGGDKKVLANLITGKNRTGFYEKFGFKLNAGMTKWVMENNI